MASIFCACCSSDSSLRRSVDVAEGGDEMRDFPAAVS
jgi:hypothetical protein